MIDETVILTAERLRDELTELRKILRGRYKTGSRQVSSDEHRKRVAQLAETWLVGLATDRDFAAAVGPETLADLAVHFQRLLTCSEHSTVRSRYDHELRSILNDYSLKVVLPLKQARGKKREVQVPASPTSLVASAFLGQSFAPSDKHINDCVASILDALGVKVVTGEKPKADRISEKVKRSIEDQSFFVGIFSRRDKIARKDEWTTSPWVVDEKAYAVGLGKRLVLLKEEGVGSIGGIQGDYEYIEFSRSTLETLMIRLTLMFDIQNGGLRS